MKKLLFSISKCTLVFLAFFLISRSTAQSVTCDSTTVGQCISGRICERQQLESGDTVYVPGTSCGGSAVVGGITAPKGVTNFNTFVGASGGIGIILFASSLLRLATIIAGIWVMFNFVFAGWIYVSSNGDAAAHTKVAEKITFSVIGILLIVVAYTIAGILSLLFFGDAGFILNPTLTTIQSVNP